MISEKKEKYPFVIANTDSSEKGGPHWCSILDIKPKQAMFFFDSFGLDGLKHFIMQDNLNVTGKVLFGTEKMTRTDDRTFKTTCSIQMKIMKYRTKLDLTKGQ